MEGIFIYGGSDMISLDRFGNHCNWLLATGFHSFVLLGYYAFFGRGGAILMTFEERLTL